jgi:hypothetical protein
MPQQSRSKSTTGGQKLNRGSYEIYDAKLGLNAEATSVIDLEEQIQDGITRSAGDVQRADVLQQHYDTIVAG